MVLMKRAVKIGKNVWKRLSQTDGCAWTLGSCTWKDVMMWYLVAPFQKTYGSVNTVYDWLRQPTTRYCSGQWPPPRFGSLTAPWPLEAAADAAPPLPPLTLLLASWQYSQTSALASTPSSLPAGRTRSAAVASSRTSPVRAPTARMASPPPPPTPSPAPTRGPCPARGSCRGASWSSSRGRSPSPGAAAAGSRGSSGRGRSRLRRRRGRKRRWGRRPAEDRWSPASPLLRPSRCWRSSPAPRRLPSPTWIDTFSVRLWFHPQRRLCCVHV